MFTCIDLFSGAGGLSCGLTKEGIETKVAVEIEKDFAKTFKLNHKYCHVINDDIANVDFHKLARKQNSGTLDLVCGGPPCQGFSTVGKKNERSLELMKIQYILFQRIRILNMEFIGVLLVDIRK